MAVARDEVVSQETYGGLLKEGETPEDALQRLEGELGTEYAQVIGTDDGQRLLEAATDQVERIPNGGVKPRAGRKAKIEEKVHELVEDRLAGGPVVTAEALVAAVAEVEADEAVAAMTTAKGPRVEAPSAMAIPVDKIDADDNVRHELGDLEELVASIKEQGILQPIVVTGSFDADGKALQPLRFRVLMGHRRLAAAKLAGYETVPAIFDPRSHLAVAGPRRTYQQLTENLQRKDLNALEEAEAIRDILATDKKLTHADVAKHVGKSRAYVSNALRLLETAPEVQEAIRTEAVTATHARAIAAVDVDLQVGLLGEVVDYGLSAKATEDRAQRVKSQADSIRKRREEKEAMAASAIALLEKVANRKTATVGIADYLGYGPDFRDMLEADGWTLAEGTEGHRFDVIKDAGSCGCDGVWRLDLTYQGKAELKPACNSGEHRAERKAALDAQWKKDQEKGNAARKAERDAELAAAAGVRSAIVGILDERPPTPLAQRLTLYALLDGDVDQELADEYLAGGDNEGLFAADDAPWTLLEAIPDDKLGGVIVRAVADFVSGGMGGPGIRSAVEAWTAARDGNEPAAAVEPTPKRKPLGKELRLGDPVLIQQVEYIVLSVNYFPTDDRPDYVELGTSAAVKAVDWKPSRVLLADLTADKPMRVWRALQLYQEAAEAPQTADDDKDLRPTGEVNPDALRGEAERSLVPEA